jgi:Tol biopolymer transport system component
MRAPAVRTTRVRRLTAGALGCAAILAVSAPAAATPLTTIRVSIPAQGGHANGPSWHAVISADGNVVAFDSTATNLALRPDTNRVRDVFVRDLRTGATRRVSLSSGEHEANGPSRVVAISDDGTRVLFNSSASNLVHGDTNGQRDVFIRNLERGSTRQVDLGPGNIKPEPTFCCPSSGLDISSSGRYVLFVSGATNLAGGCCESFRIYLRDRSTGTTHMVAKGFNFVAPVAAQISRGGRFIAYSIGGESEGSSLPGFSFVLDRKTHSRTRIDVGMPDSSEGSVVADMTAGGRYVLFAEYGQSPDARFFGIGVFLRDLRNRTTTRVDVSGVPFFRTTSTPVSVSGGGRFATFWSFSPRFIAGDTNGRADVFRRDLVGGATVRASLSAAGGQLDHNSFGGAMSRDGRAVVFWTGARAAPRDGNALRDVFLRRPFP